jgi:6-phosphogluconolactonase
MRFAFRRVVVALLGLLIIPACSSSGGGGFIAASLPPVARYAYVANNDGTVSVNRVDSLRGQLLPNGFAAAYAGAAPSSNQRVSLSPGGQFCWVVTPAPTSPPTVSTYQVNSTTGALTPVSVGFSLAPLTAPLGLAIDPLLRFAYLPDTAPGTLQSYAIGGNGALTATGNSVPVPGVSDVAVHPSGSFVYVTRSSVGTVVGYSISSSGAFTALALSPFPAGTAPAAITIDPSGRFAFVLNQTSKDLWVYTIDPSAGTLTTVTGSPFPVAALTTPSILAVDPLGRFVWAGDSTGFLAFVLDSTAGFLTPSGSLLGPALANSMSIDPTGRFAFFPTSTGTVQTYSIGTTGAVAGPAVAAVRTRGPSAVNMSLSTGTAPATRTPSFVYAANTAGVTGFTVTAVSGDLLPISGSPFAAGTAPSGVAVDPFVRFAYATDSDVNALRVVSQYTVTPGSGALVPIASPQLLPSAEAVAVEPSGQFAFTASGPGTINPFPITQATGALGAKGAGAAFGTANALAVDPAGAFVIAFDSTGGTPGAKPITFDAASGVLTAGTTLAGANFAAATVSPSGRFLYLAQASNLWLSAVTGPTSFSGPSNIKSISSGNIKSLAIDPTESFLYAAADTGQVFGFTIGPAGALTAMTAPASFVTGAGPIGATVDPSGQFAYVTSTTGGTLWAYTLGGLGGGQLLTIAGSPFAVGASPSAAAVAATIQ